MRPSKRRGDNKDRTRFAQMVSRALRQAGKTCPIRYDSEGFRLLIEDRAGDPDSLNLGNAYTEYRAAPPGQRMSALQPYIRNFLQLSGVNPNDIPAGEVVPRLLPKVRRRVRYGLADLLGSQRDPPLPTPPYRVLTEHLAVGLVVDFPDSVLEIDGSLLARWGLEPEQAFAVARDNLRGRSEAPLHSPAPGVFVSPWQDHHDASRLCLTEVVRSCEVRGDYVAAVPNPNALIVTGLEDVAGLRVLFDWVERTLALPRALSGVPVRLQQARWVPLELPHGHPEFQRLRLLRLQAEADDYRRQKEAMYEMYGDKAPPHFVATYMVARDPRTGQMFSGCTWTEGVPALLPRVEAIGFARQGNEGEIVSMGEWEQVCSVVGDLMTPVGLYPERYRVEQFPSATQLAAIRTGPAA
jgi:hypothetical protein